LTFLELLIPLFLTCFMYLFEKKKEEIYAYIFGNQFVLFVRGTY
jgi:hypothetical protein